MTTIVPLTQLLSQTLPRILLLVLLLVLQLSQRLPYFLRHFQRQPLPQLNSLLIQIARKFEIKPTVSQDYPFKNARYLKLPVRSYLPVLSVNTNTWSADPGWA